MSTRLRFLAVELENGVPKAVRSERHEITERNAGGLGYLVMCSCGWQARIRRQNALARAAKVRAAGNNHLREAFARAAQP